MIDNSISKEMVEEILGKPGTIVAYRKDGRPIYNVAGGSIDFTETGTDSDAYDPLGDTDDDDDSDDDDDDDDDDKEDSYTPPSKEQWERLLADKKKADSESAARKRLLREHGINPKDGTPLKKSPPKLTTSGNDDDDTSKEDSNVSDKRTADNAFDAKELEKRLQREMERNLLDQEADVRKEERDRSRALMVAIPEALNTEGWNGKAMPRILKLLDLDSIELHEDGDIEGLNDQITDLKKDFPEFFRRTRMKEAAEKVADRKTAGGGNKKTSSAKMEGTWAENIARALHGEG